MNVNWKKTVGFGILLGAIICLPGCGRTTIDLNNYVSDTPEGYDGMGKIYNYIDSDAIVEDNIQAFGVADDDDDWGLAPYLAVEELSGEWSQSEGLSNGDQITFTWDEDAIKAIEDSYKVKLKHSDITITVDGLEEVQSYDAFAKLKVRYEGIAPTGTIELDSSGCEISSLKYTVEPEAGLKNGDTVTVTIDVPSDCAEEYGMIPAEASKEYTVDGLPAFVMTEKEIPEETMKAMKKQAEDIKEADIAENDDVTLNKMTYIGSYFLTMKDDEARGTTFSLDSNWNVYNELYLVYKLNVTDDAGDLSYYWYCSFHNIVFLADGTCSVDTSDYDKPSGGWFGSEAIKHGSEYYAGFGDKESMFNTCVTANADRYNYTDNVKEE